ncbi:MAG: hypothetical protein JOY96_02485 [Verrucomicrobia bacterium]|nr:hypothetical protein [Verrucomicrobiota bacterium]
MPSFSASPATFSGGKVAAVDSGRTFDAMQKHFHGVNAENGCGQNQSRKTNSRENASGTLSGPDFRW